MQSLRKRDLLWQRIGIAHRRLFIGRATEDKARAAPQPRRAFSLRAPGPRRGRSFIMGEAPPGIMVAHRLPRDLPEPSMFSRGVASSRFPRGQLSRSHLHRKVISGHADQGRIFVCFPSLGLAIAALMESTYLQRDDDGLFLAVLMLHAA